LHETAERFRPMCAEEVLFRYAKVVFVFGAIKEVSYMPVVSIDVLEGKTLDQKRAAVKGITEVLVKEWGAKPEGVWIIIRDMSTENFSQAGQLRVDRK